MELRIKEILKTRGLNISQLASMVGLTQSNMSLILNGKSNPQLNTLERIATTLEIPIQELLTAPNTDVYGLVVYKGVTYRIDSVEAIQGLCRIAEKDTNA